MRPTHAVENQVYFLCILQCELRIAVDLSRTDPKFTQQVTNSNRIIYALPTGHLRWRAIATEFEDPVFEALLIRNWRELTG